ncbi:MAG: TolB family protein, partial [Solirubrobacteraceae bacterium]
MKEPGGDPKLLYRRTPENPLVQDADTWVLDIAGSAVDPTQPRTQPVLLRTGDERYPSYSPDGTQIAFRGDLDLTEPSGDEEIYVMNADGTNVRQLTSNADYDSAPSWSPDGKRIVFESAPAGTFTAGVEAHEKDIYVMRADGTHVRRLTDSPGLDEGAEFSPDGTKIVFSSDRDGQQELYVMNAAGSGPRRLTDNPSRDESPDWQALPFDTRSHQACGDDSLASGGASSVVAMRVPCHVALRVASRWAQA